MPAVTPAVSPAPFLSQWRAWLERQAKDAGPKPMVQQLMLEHLEAHNVDFARMRPGQTAAVTLPFLPAPLHLRASSSDLQVLRQVFVQGSYAFDEWAHAQPALIVDAGANIGLSSIFLANQFPRAHLIAIEPDAGNVEVLKANLAPYDAEVWHAGLWSEPCDLTIANPDDAAWAFQTIPTTGPAGQVVPGVTIEQVLARSGAARIGLLKIDIEGAERQVFASPGAATWIHQVDALCLEHHDRFAPGCAWQVYRTVTQVPFVKHQRGETELFMFTSDATTMRR